MSDNEKPRILELRVKRNTLAAEGRIIRNLARARLANGRRIRAKYPSTADAFSATAYGGWASLSNHQASVVKPEARAAHLAHAFLKGTPLSVVEDPAATENPPNWKRVEENVLTFSGGTPQVVKQRLTEWREDWLREREDGRTAYIAARVNRHVNSRAAYQANFTPEVRAQRATYVAAHGVPA